MKLLLKLIHKQYNESVDIQSASTRLMTFLVNDLLDFAQLKSGKFRMDCKNFDIKVSIQEIILILQFKADQLGITLNLEMVGFKQVEVEDQNDQKYQSYIINSDYQRIQQVVLNLVSNALKFSMRGGSVNIVCKFINEISGLTYQSKHAAYF